MTVTVMKLRAGSGTYALAAGCVDAIGPARPEAPHLVWVLHRQLPDFAGGARTLRLVSRGTGVEVTVDHVELVELNSDDIAPCRTTTSSKVLGFARNRDGVFALLDADHIVELVRQAITGDVARDVP